MLEVPQVFECLFYYCDVAHDYKCLTTEMDDKL